MSLLLQLTSSKQNPVNPPWWMSKPKDSEGRLCPIEIQLLTYRHLSERMVYAGCDEAGISQEIPLPHFAKGGWGDFHRAFPAPRGISPETTIT